MDALDALRTTLLDYTWLVNESYPWLFPLTFALTGACIGSFLNVVIYRLPRGLSVIRPARSFCPSCGKPIPGHLNLPIISWLLLRGRSSCCHTRISPRYCIVEILTAALFICASRLPTDVLTQAFISIWMALMVAIFFIDWETMVVLRRLTLAAVLAALAAAVTDPFMVSGRICSDFYGVTSALYSAGFGYLLITLVSLMGMLLFGLRWKNFTKPVPWSLQQAEDGEDILLTLGSHKLLLSKMLTEASNRITLKKATLTRPNADPTPEAGAILIGPEAVELPDGRSLKLEEHDYFAGTCSGYSSRKSAMGSGDAWICMALGALTGWDGVIVALVGGSFLGLVAAICARRGLGTPIPFGPCLITAALIWWFFADSLLLLV